jgi:SAM-dependent methyltransferase
VEMHRVLKPRGKALITVWNKYSAAHWHLAFKPKETLIPWSRKGQVYQRYYYLFNYWEMKKLVESSGFKVLKAGGIFEKNIVFIIEKI